MIGIVILNYLNWQDTVECVESILKQNVSDFYIAIVDNNSNNESSVELHKLYNGMDRISVIDAPSNLGYAKGNNLGIDFIRKYTNAARILLLNSDIILTENDFLIKLSGLSIPSNCGAVGPKIIGADGLNQNPEFFPVSKEYSMQALEAEKITIKKKIKKRIKNSRLYPKIRYAYRFVKYRNKEYTGLHGSAIMLTENYFDLFDGLYPNTFLYFEENILAIIFKKFNLEFYYYDDVELYHKEDQSSILAWENSDIVKQKFLKESIRESLKVFDYDSESLKKIINYPR